MIIKSFRLSAHGADRLLRHVLSGKDNEVIIVQRTPRDLFDLIDAARASGDAAQLPVIINSAGNRGRKA